jgi:aspartyl-tRNA(Asn)/glutamyl-tRNA(Gln) amidotransferase subunit C
LSRIDAALVHKVARLARLDLDEQDQQRYGRDLARILDHVAALDRMPPRVPLAGSSAAPCGLRADAVKAPSPVSALLDSAPDRAGHLFRVPVVLEGSDAG